MTWIPSEFARRLLPMLGAEAWRWCYEVGRGVGKGFAKEEPWVKAR